MRFFEANRNRQTARLNAVAGAPTAGRAASATAAAAAAAPPIPPNIVAFFQVGQVK